MAVSSRVLPKWILGRCRRYVLAFDNTNTHHPIVGIVGNNNVAQLDLVNEAPDHLRGALPISRSPFAMLPLNCLEDFNLVLEVSEILPIQPANTDTAMS